VIELPPQSEPFSFLSTWLVCGSGSDDPPLTMLFGVYPLLSAAAATTSLKVEPGG
jgi:hypothetical protein